MLSVLGKSRCNDKMRISVDAPHFLGLYPPIFLITLDNAKRIDPYLR